MIRYGGNYGKIQYGLQKIRLENESLKEDIVMLEETINSIREHLKIMLRVGEFGRTEEENFLRKYFLKSIHTYINILIISNALQNFVRNRYR